MSVVPGRLLYSTATVAELVETWTRWVDYEIAKGHLRVVKIGERGIRIMHAELIRWLDTLADPDLQAAQVTYAPPDYDEAMIERPTSVPVGPTRLTYKMRSAAEQLDVSERFLHDEITEGRLASIRVGERGVRIEHEALLQWIADRREDTQRGRY